MGREETQAVDAGTEPNIKDGGMGSPTSAELADRSATKAVAISLPADEQVINEPNYPPGFRGRLAHWSFRLLIFPKLIYLTLNMAIYATHNYTAMYFYKMWGLEVYQFGAVSSLAAIQFVGALFWGHLADRTGRHKRYLIVCTILYCVSFCLLELKPFDGRQSVALKIIYSSIMYGLSCFFVSCLFPLVDAQIFSLLAHHHRHSKEVFGRQRLWGTVGHALVTVIVALSIQTFGYAGIFLVLIGGCAAFLACVIFGLPSNFSPVKRVDGHHGPGSGPAQDEPQTAGSADLLKGSPTCMARCRTTPAISLLFNPHFSFLAIVILCAGYVRSVMSNFLGFYMQKEMEQSELAVAIAIVFRMVSELAIFFYNKQLLRRLGVHWMLIIAQIAGGLRCLAYSLLPPHGNWFYLSFAIELLKGTSTACLISAGVRMASDIAPFGCENTAQSYISGIYSGLSLAIGGALGGFIIYLLPAHSVASLFYITFWMGLVATILCLLKYSLVDRVILVPRSWRRSPSKHASPIHTASK